MSLLVIFVGWQSFAQSVASFDTVYALADNNIQFTIPTSALSAGDTVLWSLDGSPISTSVTGMSFQSPTPNYTNNVLRIQGSTATGFKQPTDSLTAQAHTITVSVRSAGGCTPDSVSEYRVLVLPYMKSMPVTWNDSGALCANNPIQDTLTATKPALSTTWSSVKVGDITWADSTTGSSAFASISSGITMPSANTSQLAFTTPDNTNAVLYRAEAAYSIYGNPAIIVSAANTGHDGHSTSRNVHVQATAAPTAPVLNGSTSSPVTGW